MRKYLTNGEEVEVLKELGGGFLVSTVYETESEDGECEEFVDVNKFFVDVVFDNPPTVRLHKDIEFLNSKISSLQKEVEELQKTKDTERQTIGKISKVTGLDMVVNYLTKEFQYVLTDQLKVIDRQRIYTDCNISVDLLDGVVTLYRKEKYGDRRLIGVFDSKEEAESARIIRVLERIKNCQWEHSLTDMENGGLINTQPLKDAARTRREEIAKKQKQDTISECEKTIREKTELLKKLKAV